MMQSKKSKKIFVYFILLILVGSINNINLNNINFYSIKNIHINGLSEAENQNLLENIKKLNLKNIFFINYSEISAVFNSNSFIEKYQILKKYPSSLDIEIKKTNFLAKINHNNKTFIIGSNGKLIKNIKLNNYLPYIFGKPDIDNFLKFKKQLDKSRILYNEIKNLYFFPSGRWDLQLQNNIILKLPKENSIDALNNAFDILKINNLRDLKSIDLRVQNQIIIND